MITLQIFSSHSFFLCFWPFQLYCDASSNENIVFNIFVVTFEIDFPSDANIKDDTYKLIKYKIIVKKLIKHYYYYKF